VAALTRRDREARRRYFEEERKPERMNPATKGRGMVSRSESLAATETSLRFDAVRIPNKSGTD